MLFYLPYIYFVYIYYLEIDLAFFKSPTHEKNCVKFRLLVHYRVYSDQFCPDHSHWSDILF